MASLAQVDVVRALAITGSIYNSHLTQEEPQEPDYRAPAAGRPHAALAGSEARPMNLEAPGGLGWPTAACLVRALMLGGNCQEQAKRRPDTIAGAGR